MNKKNISTSLLTSLFVWSISLLFGCSSPETFFQNYTTNTTRETPYTKSFHSHYNIKTPQQEALFKELLRIADITFPQEGASINETVKNLLQFIEATQEKFTIRTNNQERWEIAAPEWILKNQNLIVHNGNSLEVIKSIFPQKKETDLLCILGSTRTSMKTRLDDAKSFMMDGHLKTNNLLLLTGDRMVTAAQGDKELDGSIESLQMLAQEHNLDSWKSVTEEIVMQAAYLDSGLQTIIEKNDYNLYAINAPKQANKPRATTQDTIVALLEWLEKHPEIRHITFVSNQPYVLYQKAIIESVFYQRSASISFEVVGRSSSFLYEDKLAIIGNIGSFLWAATPSFLATLDIQDSSEEVIKLCEKLYKKVESLYKRLPVALQEK